MTTTVLCVPGAATGAAYTTGACDWVTTGAPGGGEETTCESGSEAQPPTSIAKPHAARTGTSEMPTREEREFWDSLFITQPADRRSNSRFLGKTLTHSHVVGRSSQVGADFDPLLSPLGRSKTRPDRKTGTHERLRSAVPEFQIQQQSGPALNGIVPLHAFSSTRLPVRAAS